MYELQSQTCFYLKFFSEVNEMIERICLENGYYYSENGTVCENDFLKDKSHLQNFGKKILSQNFIVNLQMYDNFLGRWETLV